MRVTDLQRQSACCQRTPCLKSLISIEILMTTLRSLYGKWHILVHVCQKWRQIAFASPLRLNLRILCTRRTPVRKNLHTWPALPIVFRYSVKGNWRYVEDDLIAALEHPDRVCDVDLDVPGPLLEKMAKVMQQPFTVLTRLSIKSIWDAPTLPGGFLGGSAPSLQKIYLYGVSYPSLPT